MSLMGALQNTFSSFDPNRYRRAPSGGGAKVSVSTQPVPPSTNFNQGDPLTTQLFNSPLGFGRAGKPDSTIEGYVPANVMQDFSDKSNVDFGEQTIGDVGITKSPVFWIVALAIGWFLWKKFK